MNSHHNNVNFHSTPSQVPVLRFEDANMSQVVPLHILDGDLSSEMMIPHVYITECPLPLLIGSEKEVMGVKPNHQIIPVVNDPKAKTYPQSYNLRMEPYKSAPTKSLMSTSYQISQTNCFNEVAPNSSNYSMNEQIELISPLDYAYKPTQCEQFQSTQINSQSLSYPCNFKEAVKTDNNSEKIVKENRSDKTGKRKVQNYVHISDVRAPQRAIAVLPTALQIRGKNNIFPRRTLPARIRFGPVEGIHNIITPSQADILVSLADAPIFLLKKDNEIIHIDVSDKDKCNWMGLLPPGDTDANVWLYQDNNELYAITTEPINARRPLKLGYSKKYAEQHQLTVGVPVLDLETVLSSNPKQWWCNECNRALPSASLLQRHADVYHKDDIISTRRGYRCLKCRRMFCRLFTLRRHISKHCTAKTEKPVETTEPNPALDLNSTLNNEDSRIPSDESFQNFSNGLDFSTNLFDTDRISNLDISSNSRADDFNPYDISFRDDTCTSNDLSFSKLTETSNLRQTKKKCTNPCAYCGQVISKGNRRKHISECSRKLECACGKSFRNKEKLAQHFLKEHSAENGTASKTNHTLPEKKNYACEQCTSKRFKRRGMLVNHLWRAHRIVSTSKVERPVRHYPCVACSKIYRSAAKRDRHIDVHHPGAEKLAVQSIAGGVKSCEPAACPHCPRQYATRAKLLQHVRAQHKTENQQALGSKDNSTINS